MNIIEFIIYLLSWLIPKSKNIWVFGSQNNTFTDNTKYFYIWITKNKPEIHAYWVTENIAVLSQLRGSGYKALHRRGLRTLLLCTIAKYHIYSFRPDETIFYVSGGSQHINLWHGVGIKNIEYGIVSGPNAKFHQDKSFYFRFKNMSCFIKPDMVLSTSKSMSKHFSRCFRIGEENCPIVGYPRLDCAFDEDLRRLALDFGHYEDLLKEFQSNDEVYIYMPTWRDTRFDFMENALPRLEALSDILCERSAVLYIKMHPYANWRPNNLPKNIKLFPNDLDVYPILDRFDLLITDYSSIFYDWIFVKKAGVLLYPFDLKDYMQIDRDFAFPYYENVSGVVAKDFDSLCAVLRDGCALKPLPVEDLQRLRYTFWGGALVPASQYLFDILYSR